jgi:hypothetical protein
VKRSIHDPDVLIAKTFEPDEIFDLARMLPPCLNGNLNPSDVYTDRLGTQNTVRRKTARIVAYYSISQSIKGIATAGGSKTARYVAQKLRRVYFKR